MPPAQRQEDGLARLDDDLQHLRAGEVRVAVQVRAVEVDRTEDGVVVVEMGDLQRRDESPALASDHLGVKQHQGVVVQRRDSARRAEPERRVPGQLGRVAHQGQAPDVGQQWRKLRTPQSLVVGGHVVIVGRAASQHLVDELRQPGHAPVRELVLLELRVEAALGLDFHIEVAESPLQVRGRPALHRRPVARQVGNDQRPAAAHIACDELVARGFGSLLDHRVVRCRGPQALQVLEHRFKLALQLLEPPRGEEGRLALHLCDRGGAGLGIQACRSHRGLHRVGRAVAQAVFGDPLAPAGIDRDRCAGQGTGRGGDGHGGGVHRSKLQSTAKFRA